LSALCDEHGDVATASLLENWIDEAERRHGSYSRPRERLSKQKRLPKAIRRNRIPDEDLERFQTVGDTVDYV
jgi:transposase-like protein